MVFKMLAEIYPMKTACKFQWTKRNPASIDDILLSKFSAMRGLPSLFRMVSRGKDAHLEPKRAC
jgi:hypothetical protein